MARIEDITNVIKSTPKAIWEWGLKPLSMQAISHQKDQLAHSQIQEMHGVNDRLLVIGLARLVAGITAVGTLAVMEGLSGSRGEAVLVITSLAYLGYVGADLRKLDEIRTNNINSISESLSQDLLTGGLGKRLSEIREGRREMPVVMTSPMPGMTRIERKK